MIDLLVSLNPLLSLIITILVMVLLGLVPYLFGQRFFVDSFILDKFNHIFHITPR
jgi:multisubunit Na+/H+ antiporter MnhB subunit